MDSSFVSPAVRWAIALWPDDAGRGAVSAFCVEHGISRSAFYKIRARSRERGAMGAVEPDSRRPRSSPRVTDPTLIEAALQIRASLAAAGWDHGPLSVLALMRRQGLNPPSRSTLARAFARAGVAGPDPAKKPRSAYRRFRYPAPNCCWQLDATDWTLADGQGCVIFQLIDDHSRLALASLAAWGETSDAAIAVVRTAIHRWGVPQKVLTDNGRALNPSRLGITGRLVTYLRDLGITPITGKPYKPTTQGKNERVHRTLLQWLNKQPPAATLTQLQAQLDTFDAYYNTKREHQELGMTPREAWDATPLAPEPDPPQVEPLPTPPANVAGATTRTVTPRGCISMLGTTFKIGKTYIGATVHVTWDHTTVEFFDHDGQSILRHPRPDPGTPYVGNGRPRGFMADQPPTTNPETPEPSTNT